MNPITILVLLSAGLAGDGWPQWRGPAGTGMAQGEAPLTWSDDENVRWKVEVPGRGFSTPVLRGDRIFLTTAVPTGEEAPEPEDEPEEEGGGRRRRGGFGGFGGASGPQPEQAFRVLCLSRTDGSVLWETTVNEAFPHEGYHRQYGSFASASPVIDGERLYVSFGSFGLYALDLDGELVWSKDLEVKMSMRAAFGEGTTPVIHGQALVQVYDHEGDSFIVALDKDSGEELWRQDRDEPSTWAQPLVIERGGKAQIVTIGSNRIRSYDPLNGEVVWECDGVGLNAIPALVMHEDTLLAMSGYRESVLKAIELTEDGDLAEEPLLWSTEKGLSYTCSPVLSEGKLYCLMDRGFISCFDVETGEAHYREKRLPRGSNFKASPVGAAGRLYLAAESGDVHVLKLSPDYELLATNTLEDQFFVSSPVIDRGELLLRSSTHLFCIATAPEGR